MAEIVKTDLTPSQKATANRGNADQNLKAAASLRRLAKETGEAEYNKLADQREATAKRQLDIAQQQEDQQKAAQKVQTTSADQLYTKAKLENAAKANVDETSTKKEWHLKLLGSFNNAAENTGEAFENLDRYALNFANNLYKFSNSTQKAIEGTTSGIVGSISGLTEDIAQFEQEAIHDIQGWGAGIKKALEPVGLCSAIGDMTDIVKNPLGAPQYLANSLTTLVGKISPGFVEKMENSYKSLNLEGIANLPSKMMGSIRNLATAADAILSVPFEIMSDVYNGLMEILEAIADLIDGIVTMVMNLAMAIVKALLDAIIPVDELLEFFSAISDLASFIGDIAGMVGGFDAVTNITGQVAGFASSATSLINNPLQAIPGLSQGIGQVTGAVGQVTSALRNPEQFLPPEIGNQMKNISKIPGLGFVGNLGYSVGDTLDTLSDGVFAAALDKYADKLPILNDAFNKPQDAPPAVDTQETHSDAYMPGKAGPHQVNGAGLPEPDPGSIQPIFPQASLQQNKGPISATFGGTTITESPDGTVTTLQNGQMTSSSGPGGTFAYGITEPAQNSSLLNGSNPFANL